MTAATDLNVTVEPTTYSVTAFPDDDINSTVWLITIEARGFGRWAVCHFRQCLGADGEWDYEPRPSSREDDWIADHRFDLDEATRLAREALPRLVVNGRTAGQFIAERRAREASKVSK